MTYDELGIFPITTEIQTRIISFWSKLIENCATYKLSPTVYSTVNNMHANRHLKSQRLDNVKILLHSYSGIWYSQSFINSKWLTNSFTQTLEDSYIQKWYFSINIISSSNTINRLFKDTFEPSSYIKQLPHFLCRRFMAFRTRNHRFPVELEDGMGNLWMNAYFNFVIVI